MFLCFRNQMHFSNFNEFFTHNAISHLIQLLQGREGQVHEDELSTPQFAGTTAGSPPEYRRHTTNKLGVPVVAVRFCVVGSVVSSNGKRCGTGDVSSRDIRLCGYLHGNSLNDGPVAFVFFTYPNGDNRRDA